jgi:hypothetical protein
MMVAIEEENVLCRINMKTFNEMLTRTIELTKEMISLAEQGDRARKDVGCGILYGLLRDSAYKIRKVAEDEKEEHIKRGIWPEDGKDTVRKTANLSNPK